MKTIAETLGVARSNIDRARQRASAETRAADPRWRSWNSAADIRRLVDSDRPTGTGGSPRSSSASGEPPASAPVNAKRVYRLMKKHGLLLAPAYRTATPART